MDRPDKLYAFVVADTWTGGSEVVVQLAAEHPVWCDIDEEWEPMGNRYIGVLDPWLFAACFPVDGYPTDKRILLTIDPYSLALLESCRHGDAVEQA